MTPVGLDDGTRDRESEPCAFTARFALGATAMEAFEDPFDLIGGYRVADIRDGETDAGCVRVNPDRDLPLFRCVTKRIRDQVRQRSGCGQFASDLFPGVARRAPRTGGPARR